MLNTPRRGIGDKTQRDVVQRAADHKQSAWSVCVGLAQGRGTVPVTVAQRRGVKQLVELVTDARKKADEVRCALSLSARSPRSD